MPFGKYLCLLPLFLLFPYFSIVSVHAQEVAPSRTIHKKFVVRWEAPKLVKYYRDGKEQHTWSNAFEGCRYDEANPNFPYYQEIIEIGKEEKIINIKPTGENPLNQCELTHDSLLQVAIDTSINRLILNNSISINYFMENGKKFLLIKYFPLCLMYQFRCVVPDDHSPPITKLVKRDLFEFDIILKNNPSLPNLSQKTSEDGENSVLASGDWYKIAVVNDGIYKIDRSFLQGLGMNLSGLNPKNLALYGKPGGMIPQANSENRYYDLAEIAVHVHGGEDGSFDEGDYLQFYGQSAHQSRYLVNGDKFTHENHLYSDTTYYFLHVKKDDAKRITERNSIEGENELTRGRVFSYVEEDKNNLIKMGRMWFGEKMENNRLTYRIPVPNLRAESNVRVQIRVAARSGDGTQFVIRESGRQIGTINMMQANIFCYFCNYAQINTANLIVPATDLTDGSLDLEIQYVGSGISGGWLDYIRVDYQSDLKTNRLPFTFQAVPSDTSKSQKIIFDGDLSNLFVWDVSDPMNIIRQNLASGSNNTFGTNGQPCKIVVLQPNSGNRPIAIGKIGNQNLHGLSAFDYLIVSHPNFLSQAEELAEIHRKFIPNPDNTPKRVQVVNVNDVYTEFSAGSRDISAIRNMVKHYYDRYKDNPQDQPKYLLLFGDGGYDNKGINGKASLIPTYQARESMDPTVAFVSDDYLTFMDENEGFWGEGTNLYEGDNRLEINTMDLTVGRFPVNTMEEARIMVQKIKDYITAPQIAGDWMKRVLLIGDYKQGECNHMREVDGLDRDFIQKCAPCFNTDKVYYDQFPQVQLAEGLRFPEGKQVMMERLQEGQLIVNYTGHGSETGLSNSYFFEIPDNLSLRNGVRLPFWITATCEYGRYDDPNRTCGIEYLLLNPFGGAIGSMTSVRMVYSSGNEAINRNFYNFLFCENQNYNIGDVFRLAKNRTLVQNGVNLNTRSFSLLGDPGLRLIQPRYDAVITKINNQPFNQNRTDTLRALNRVSLEGEIRNEMGQIKTDFNGSITITTLDKPQTLRTTNCRLAYSNQKNRIYQGLASVTNGRFQVNFTVPLDISYEIGDGKINMFAVSDIGSAFGCTQDIVVCCTDEEAAKKCDAVPNVKVFIDNNRWKNGSKTGTQPLLYVEVEDEMGINTTGLGVGRQLTAILNRNYDAPIIINPFYRSDLDDYKKGTIVYRMPELPDGKHTLEVKVWNVCNNSAVGFTEFEVGKGFDLLSVGNFPNPMTESTQFTFNYTLFNAPVVIDIHIYNTNGQLMRTLSGQVIANESIYEGMTWDGTDHLGRSLSGGVYPYKISVTNKQTGEEQRSHGKIVLIK